MAGETPKFTAVVLAGRRGATDALADALAAADPSGHHALLDVAGVPMLLRVVRALQTAPSVGRIAVCIDDPSALDRVPELRAARRDGSIVCRAARGSPSESVVDALDWAGPDARVLVATADHALLTSDMIEHFVAQARAGDDALVAVVAARLLRARFPESKRTYLRLRDDAYSGANLFAFLTPRARRVAAFWRRAEQFRKRPWRLVSAFGPVSLLLFLTRRLDLEAALARASRAMGARVRAIPLPWPEAAVDVDRPDDLVLVRAVLAERARAAHPAAPPETRG